MAGRCGLQLLLITTELTRQGAGTAAPGLLSPGRPGSSIGMTMNDSKDLRWIEDFGDELTMAIAMRDWEAAVGLIERCKGQIRRIITAADNQRKT